MLLIPYRAPNGLVQACQVRFMCRKLSDDSVRYVWLSTPDKSGNISCGSPLHFASYKDSSFDKPILLTEGALKAETALTFNKGFNVLASAGVACSHDDITIAVSPFRSVFIAFDADYYENHYVARALAKLLTSLLALKKVDFYNRIKLLSWNRKYKGIDDALLQNTTISHQSIIEWYKSISVKCQNEAKQFLPKVLVASV